MVRTLFMAFLIMTLTSCIPQQNATPNNGPFEPYNQTIINNQPFSDLTTGHNHQSGAIQHNAPVPSHHAINGKVALLLPLSGQHSEIGQSILKAAQLALFDINDPSFELIPLDTKGTAQGASQAVIEAANKNVGVIMGPLLANAVQSAGKTAARYGLQVIGFTTDWNKIGQNIFTMGILPFDQGVRLAQYAARTNKKNVVIIDPKTNYSQAVINAFEQTALPNGINIVKKLPIHDPRTIATTLANNRDMIDGLIMPFGNPQISLVARALLDRGLSPTTIPWMGVGLWDTPDIINNPLFTGAIYAAPTPDMRQNFQRQYKSIYGDTPQRLASLGYDATALSAVLLKQSNANVHKSTIQNPSGFAGIDGIFRFKSNGMVERGLSIHRINGSRQATIVSPAPQSFMN